MSASDVNYQPTSRSKRQKISDSGVETQTSPTSQCDSSPAPTHHSVSKQKRPEKYLCDLCNPPKSNGFRTINDLIRHKKGVHFVYEAGDKIWRCQVPGCACIDKIWPRRDNFSSHLKRMHFNGNEKKVKEVIDRFEERYDPIKHGSMSTATKLEGSRGRGGSKATPSINSPMLPPASSSFASSSFLIRQPQPGQCGQPYGMPGPYMSAVHQQIPRSSRASFTGNLDRPAFTTAHSVFRGQPGGVDPALLTLPSSKKRARPGDAVTAPPNAETWFRQRREMKEDDQDKGQFSDIMPSSMEDFVGVGFGPQIPIEPLLSSNMTSEHTIDLLSEPKHGLDRLEDVFANLPQPVKEAFRKSSPGTLMEFFSKMREEAESAGTKNIRKRP